MAKPRLARGLYSIRGKRITRSAAKRFLDKGQNPIVKNARGKKTTLLQALGTNSIVPGSAKPLFSKEIVTRLQFYEEKLKENNSAKTQALLEKTLYQYRRFASKHPKQAEKIASLLNTNTGKIAQSRFVSEITMEELEDYEINDAWYWY